MIAIEGRFNLPLSGYDTSILSATTNAQTSGGSSDLSGIINRLNAQPFVSTFTSNENGKFYEKLESGSRNIDIVGERQTFNMGGMQEYNGEMCFLIYVAYETDVSKYMTYIDEAIFHHINVSSVQGTYTIAVANLNKGEDTIGILVNVYVPTSLITPDADPTSFIPTSVVVNTTLIRHAKHIGTPVEIEMISDYATNELQFRFDNARYAPTAKIDGVTYEVLPQMADDAQSVAYYYVDVPASQKHTIVFEEWSEPYSAFVLSGIMAMFAYKPEISRRSIISFNREVFDRDNAERLSYGVISCGGSLQFNDYDGTYKALAERLALNSNIIFDAFLVNTLANKQQSIAYMKCANWNYDNQSRSVSVTLKDDLEEWQDIQVEGFGYDPRNPSKVLANKSMADLYKWLHEKTPKRYFMLSFAELDRSTQVILTNTTIEYPLLESGNLWAQWNKLCVACGLHIYKNSRGDTVCAYTDGV
jgi:hypothetical protein